MESRIAVAAIVTRRGDRIDEDAFVHNVNACALEFSTLALAD